MSVSPSRIDLNLIRVFIAIYEARSLTAAAERLYLTQPTVSYGLAKLRTAFQDSLFIRGANGMMPTVIADLAYARFSEAMANIDSAIELTQQFIPQSSTHRFRVALTALGALMFVPPIMRRLQEEAPGVEIEVVQIAVAEVEGWLTTGKVDVAIGSLPDLEASTRNRVLFTEHYLCLLRENHPTIRDTLDLHAYTAARHVLVSPTFSGHERIEERLRQLGIKRKIALHLPHFALLPQLIADTDLLITLQSRLAKLFASSYGELRAMEIPFDIPQFEVSMYWHQHHEEKAAHRWLRNTLFETLRDLTGDE